MKTWKHWCALLALLSVWNPSQAGNYTNFTVAIYLPVGVVQSFEQPEKLARDWDIISHQLKVDKVFPAYDNHTFIVESFLPAATEVRISVTNNAAHLKNLVSGEIIEGQAPPRRGWSGSGRQAEEGRFFNVHLLPHSYAVFSIESPQ